MKLYKIFLLLIILVTCFSCYAKEDEVTTEVETIPLSLESSRDFIISSGGEYNFSGTYSNTSIIIEAGKEDKVYITLDNLSITNSSKPVIYLKSGDKLYITTTDSQNSLTVNGEFLPDGDTNLDAVIFSRSDLHFSGTGVLEINSTEGNGITSKDDIKIKGGEININSFLDAIEANDSITIDDGSVNITSQKDGLHSEYDEDPTVGIIEINGGVLNISVKDDAVYGHSEIRVTGGKINVTNSYEGLESTKVYISGGETSIYSSDDGINATSKNGSDVFIDISGGTINVEVGAGDTDAFDSNGDLSITGGEIYVTTPRSSFDADGEVLYTGGKVTVNGIVVEEIEVQRFGQGRGGRAGKGR